jgi:hypothetical protein
MLFQAKRKKKKAVNFSKKKKGVSEMIGYILLVTVGIAMSVLVFAWLKGYVPNDSVECSDGVSLFIKQYTYDCNTKILTIQMKNNGRFSLSGYLIHATTQPNQELATEDLAKIAFYHGTFIGNGEVKFGNGASTATNSFTPSSEETDSITHVFDLSSATFTQIYSIEIVPTRYETINGKEKVATCTKAKIKQDLVCS